MKSQSSHVAATSIALFALGASLVSLPATAEDTAAPVPEKFRALDGDRDGYLSPAETRKLRDYTRAFTEADQNHDGRLDPDEFIKAESIYERERAASYVDDSIITAKVKAALLKETHIDSLDVSVETYKGHVLLSGFVDDAKQREHAVRTAATVQGVVEVKDALAVK